MHHGGHIYFSEPFLVDLQMQLLFTQLSKKGGNLKLFHLQFHFSIKSNIIYFAWCRKIAHHILNILGVNKEDMMIPFEVSCVCSGESVLG